MGSITLGAWFAACGIDETGTFDSNDGSIGADAIVDQVVKEVNPEANPPTLTCQEAGMSLDASCLGKPVPTGWQPIAIQLNTVASCGDGGFVSTPLETAPQLAQGACNCSACGASGDWTCGASIMAGQLGNNNCTLETFDASASVCWQNITHSSYGVYITRYGNPQCGGGQQTGNLDATAMPITACTPQDCDTDFCAMGNQGFKLCIYNASVSDGGCPTDFPQGRVVGPSATVTCDSCQQCALANADAGCTGAVTAFSGGNCTGTNDGVSVAGACADLGSVQYNSLFYDAGQPPTPSCGGPTTVTSGKAALDQPSTICCAN